MATLVISLRGQYSRCECCHSMGQGLKTESKGQDKQHPVCLPVHLSVCLLNANAMRPAITCLAFSEPSNTFLLAFIEL